MVPIVSPSEVLLTRRLACSPPAPILLAWSCAVHSVSSSLGERGGRALGPLARGVSGATSSSSLSGDIGLCCAGLSWYRPFLECRRTGSGLSVIKLGAPLKRRWSGRGTSQSGGFLRVTCGLRDLVIRESSASEVDGQVGYL